MERSSRYEVIKAIANLNFQVTASDIVVATGLPLLTVIRLLNSIAFECAAHLEVSSDGKISYKFPRHFVLRTGLSRSRKLCAKLSSLLLSFVLLIFKSIIALTLLTSLVLFYSLAFLCLQIFSVFTNMETRSSELKDEFFSLLLTLSKGRKRKDGDKRLHRLPGLLNSCFAFLFGPQDPNSNWQHKRWQRLSAMIKACGGVILPEQARLWSRESDGEDFDLEVLQRFDGIPLATESGDILFYFPSLLDTKTDIFSAEGGKEYLEEDSWIFCELPKQELRKVTALALVNLLACNAAFLIVHQIPALFQQAFIYGSVIFFWFYGNIFLALPLARLPICIWRNHKITVANSKRKILLESLQYPTQEMLSRMQEANELALKYAVESSKQQIVFSTEEDSLAQFIQLADS